jgi:hypothetical protein
MIIFVTLWLLAFDCGSTLAFFASETFVFEPFLINIFNTFDANHSIFLLEVALRNPNGANVMNPNIMATWDSSRVSRFNEIVIVALFFFLSSFSDYFYCSFLIFFNFIFLFTHVLLFLLIVRTFLGILVVAWVKLFENVGINVN